MTKEIVLFIGLGNMGRPMAENLVQAGYTVYGSDMNPASLEAFKAAGGKKAEPFGEVLEQADIVLSSLPTPAIVESVYLGEAGVVPNAKPGALLIDFSTISPELNENVAEHAKENGLDYLGCPVSGSVAGAKDGTLTMMAGGTEEAFNRALPILDVLGGKSFHLGEEAGTGTKIKLLNNLMIGFYTQAVAEMVVLGERMGLDRQKIYDVLSVSFGQSRLYDRNHTSYMIHDEYTPGFSTDLLLKDLKLAQQMARVSGTPMPIADPLIEQFEEAVKEGYGPKDMAAIYERMSKMAELEDQKQAQVQAL